MADDNMLTTIEGLVKLAKSQKKMQEQRTKLLSSLAETGMKKGMMNPFQQMMMQQYMQQQGGQQGGRQDGGQYKITMTSTGPKMTPMSFKDIIENIYMKPQDQWTKNERQQVEQWKEMKRAAKYPFMEDDTSFGGEMPPLPPAEKPQGGGIFQPSSWFKERKQKSSLPKGITEDDIIVTMKANNMSREEVMKRLGSM